MTEIKLMCLSYNPTDDTINFDVKTTASADRLLASKACDVSARLRDLADKLDAREYPFSQIGGDPNVIVVSAKER